MPGASITKNALANAFKTLVAEKAFAKVGIGDICEHCGMNRRSFYYHFQDKYDLVIWIFDTEFLGMVYQNEYESPWEFVLDVCNYFYANRPFYLELFSVSGQNSFREYFTEVLTPLFQKVLEPEFGDAAHAAFWGTFYADAFIISLEKWLKSNEMQPEAYVELLRVGIGHASGRLAHDGQHAPQAADTSAASPGE